MSTEVQSAPSAKKRKRQDEDRNELSFSLCKDADRAGSHPLPVLAMRAALTVPADMPFEAWISMADKNSVRLHGESGKMEWDSREEETGMAGSTYYIAVHRKSHGSVSLLPVRTHVLTPIVRSYRDLPERGGGDDPALLDYAEQRNLLGTTFGPKKTQRKIGARLRNKIDISAPDMVKHIDDMVKQITEASKGQATPEEVQRAHEESLPIPPFDRDATHPKSVYAERAVAPKKELEAMRIFDFIDADTNEERIYMLPWRHSRFINERMNAVISEIKGGDVNFKKKKRLRMIIYLSVLFAFRSRREAGKDGPRSRLDNLNLAPVVVTGISDRFSEKLRNGYASVTTTSQKRLLHWILVLALMIDGFSVDVDILAEDLNVSRRSLDVSFRGLGCRTAAPTPSEREKLQALAQSQNISISTDRHGKRAVLITPLKFPDPPRRKVKLATKS